MRTQILVGLIGIAVAAGCGGGVGIDDFQSKLADAFCANAVTCKQMPDKATCKASINTKGKTLQTLIAKAKAGKTIKYDEDKAGDCVDFIESGSCSFDGFYASANPCRDVFTGTVATPGACVVDEECTSGSCMQTDMACDPNTTCCAGTCMAVPAKVALGGDCTTAQCVDTAYCSATNKCTAPITGVGAACDELDACANPMYCDVFSTNKTCVLPAATGATCDPMRLLPCADGRDYCDATALKCTALVAVGTACEGANGAECIGYADCTNMTCVAKATAGKACIIDAQMNNNCLGDLDCTAGSCVLPPAATACPRLSSEPPDAPPVSTSTTRPVSRVTAAKRVRAVHWLPQLTE